MIQRQVSVIIPFHKEYDTLARAIKSVLAQRSDLMQVPLDIIVVNDGRDPTERLLDALKDVKVTGCARIVSNTETRGPGGARNCGINHARGDVIAFLDADDFWLPGKLDEQLRALMCGATFVATGYEFARSNKRVLPPVDSAGKVDVFRRLGIGTSTVLLTRELLGATRFTNLRFSQDVDLWHRLSVKTEFHFRGVQRVYVMYSEYGGSRNKLVQAKYFWRAMTQNNLRLAYKYDAFVRYVIRGFSNHYRSWYLGRSRR